MVRNCSNRSKIGRLGEYKKSLLGTSYKPLEIAFEALYDGLLTWCSICLSLICVLMS